MEFARVALEASVGAVELSAARVAVSPSAADVVSLPPSAVVSPSSAAVVSPSAAVVSSPIAQLNFLVFNFINL